MITDDHKLTAEAVAKEIGIMDRTSSMSGKEHEEIDIPSLQKKLEEIKVFVRVSPEHKLKIL